MRGRCSGRNPPLQPPPPSPPAPTPSSSGLQARSLAHPVRSPRPRILLASCTSFTWMVTRLAWMAHRLLHTSRVRDGNTTNRSCTARYCITSQIIQFTHLQQSHQRAPLHYNSRILKQRHKVRLGHLLQGEQRVCLPPEVLVRVLSGHFPNLRLCGSSSGGDNVSIDQQARTDQLVFLCSAQRECHPTPRKP